MERELFLITSKSDSWDSTDINTQWSTFAAKFQLFAELESKSNKSIRELLTAHKSEKSSIPSESPGIHSHLSGASGSSGGDSSKYMLAHKAVAVVKFILPPTTAHAFPFSGC